MGKNNYIIQKEKQIAELRKKVRIDSAYIGAGHVLALFELGLSDETIELVMQKTNEIWQELYSQGINPIKYCYEKTGFQVLTDEQERKLIYSYFDEGEEE